MGSNKTMTPEEIRLQMEDFLSSGLTMQDYADSYGLNYSTFKSRVQKWKKEHGIPLERQGFIRSGNPKPIISRPIEQTQIEEKKEAKTMQSNETIIPATKKEDQKASSKMGRPSKDYNETKYSFGMKEEEFDLLRAYCTIKGKSIKEVIQESIKEYLAKPENQNTMNEAERLVKIIKKSSK